MFNHMGIDIRNKSKNELYKMFNDRMNGRVYQDQFGHSEIEKINSGFGHSAQEFGAFQRRK